MDGKALSVVMKRTCARVRSYKALEQDAQTTLRSKCKSMEVGGWAMAWEKKKKKDKTCITDGLIQQKWGGMRGQTELRSSCVLL